LKEQNVRSGTRSRVVSAPATIGCICAALLLCPATLLSSEKAPSKIICREELSASKRTELEKKLRASTGWPQLAFDSAGALHSGDQVAGGSKTARELLGKALSGPNVVILEDASNRADVVFCRVIPGRFTSNAASMPPAFVVQIDFADFDHLMGDAAALSAFDVGWGLLHEIDHVVNDSLDAEVAGHTGECELHINQMRRECNLPERADYFFNYLPHAEEGPFLTKFVRLAFEWRTTPTGRRRRYWVTWDAALVGGLLDQNQIATVR
jgi:hypothetical protein